MLAFLLFAKAMAPERAASGWVIGSFGVENNFWQVHPPCTGVNLSGGQSDSTEGSIYALLFQVVTHDSAHPHCGYQLSRPERYWINHFEVRPHYSSYESCLMLDPDALSEQLVKWGIERRYVFPFQSLGYITSLFKDHDQGNMPIRLIPVSKIFEFDGKISPKSQNLFISRIIWLNATNLLDFGEVDLVAFDENWVCVRDLRSLVR